MPKSDGCHLGELTFFAKTVAFQNDFGLSPFVPLTSAFADVLYLELGVRDDAL
jgi:hypothetical protein